MGNLIGSQVLSLMKEILAKQGREPEIRLESTLQELRFRSLDFAELALRMELLTQKTLQLEASVLRSVKCVGDVVAFFEKALR